MGDRPSDIVNGVVLALIFAIMDFKGNSNIYTIIFVLRQL